MSQEPNALIHESSPYLLQHAYNPVKWLAWSEAAIAKAQSENKPILVSIGYSACHWCHVMEHESFEDEAVATLMNEHFVCIKVDREERPDVDHLYMDAVQLMTSQGGWPLNCFALPDGRPFFGGTYFQKDRWIQVLEQVHLAFTSDYGRVLHYAEELTQGIHALDQQAVQVNDDQITDEAVDAAVGRWLKRVDQKEGGFEGAPKFPMPNNYRFLLHYAHSNGDHEVLQHVLLTLHKMAFGGIYDQVGGGFARYAVDALWKVPHFEKMLYDNGQIISLYAEAYQFNKDPLWLEIVEDTTDFMNRELSEENGAFYAALDADSEGVEGKYYVWKLPDLNKAAGKDLPLLERLYHFDQKGLWEHGNYILQRKQRLDSAAKASNLPLHVVRERQRQFRKVLFQLRDVRERPSLDDKCLTSWNAMAARGYVDAYQATGNPAYLERANSNLGFILKHQLRADGGLWRSFKQGKSSVEAYLEDYAHCADAFVRAYEATFQLSHLEHAKQFLDYIEVHFDRNEAGFYYFNERRNQHLVARKAEIHDNVIPASNSIVMTCFFKLGLLLGKVEWTKRANDAVRQVESHFSRHPTSYSQWMQLNLFFSEPFFEVAIVGNDCEEKRRTLAQHYLPNTVFCGGETGGSIPILEGRGAPNKTLIYVCQNGACQLPTEDTDAALAQLRN
jgi:uncharacterized protein YyaL (SSP411 family)